MGDFTEDNYLTLQHCDKLRKKLRQMLKEIRPDAVPLVDSFNMSDLTLASALGRYDGNVYEALYKWALKEPLNKSHVADGFDEFIKPLYIQKLTAKL